MSDDDEARTLERLWKGGRTGYLSAFEQMRAVVYRDVCAQRHWLARAWDADADCQEAD